MMVPHGSQHGQGPPSFARCLPRRNHGLDGSREYAGRWPARLLAAATCGLAWMDADRRRLSILPVDRGCRDDAVAGPPRRGQLLPFAADASGAAPGLASILAGRVHLYLPALRPVYAASARSVAANRPLLCD